MQKLSYVGMMALVGAAGVANAAEFGDVKGKVVFAGDKVPEQKQIDVTKDKEACLRKGPILKEDLVVNPQNKGVQWVFVWITDANGGKPPMNPALAKLEKKEVEIDQPTCAFEPHALAMREGQTLVAKNSAPVSHNVNWLGSPRQATGNRIIPPGKSEKIANLKADKRPVAISCNIHPWMNGWVRVFDHPYFAVTDKDGNFEIKGVPAGKYKIWYWSDTGYLGGAAGNSGYDVEVKAAGTDLGEVKWK